MATMLVGMLTMGRHASVIDTDFMALLPDSERSPLAQLAVEDAARKMERRLLFIIESDDEQQAKAAAVQWQAYLDNWEFVTRIDSQRQQMQMFELLFPARYQLLDSSARQWLEAEQHQQVTQRALQSIYSPFSGVTANELSQDPWLLFRNFSNQGAEKNRFSLVQGQLLSNQNGRFQFFIQGELAASPYQFETHEKIQHLMSEASRLQRETGVDIYYQGVGFFVEEAAAAAQSEISIIGGGSLAAVVILILSVFRSVRPLALCLFSVGTGVLSALFATVVVFGSVHSFTLVLGASLIGVSVDYAFHYLSLRACTINAWRPHSAIQKLKPVLLLGLVSSCLAYSGLGLTGFPALIQLALFSSVGLSAALLAVLLIYPQLTQSPAQHNPINFARAIHEIVERYGSSRFNVGLIGLLLIVSAFGLQRLEFNDDVRHLQSASERLIKHEQAVTALTGFDQSQQWLVLLGSTQEDLRQAEQELENQLQDFIKKGTISGFNSVHQFVPSTALQQQNYLLSEQLIEKQSADIQASLGLDRIVQLPEFQAVTWQQVEQAAAGLPYLAGQLEQGTHYSIITLQGLHPDSTINGLKTDIPGVQVLFVARAQEVSALMHHYRYQVLLLVAIACALVFGLLTIKLTIKDAFAVVTPPLFACLLALAVPGLLGISANLFNVVALLLILGISLDYSLFLRFHGDQVHSTMAVLLAGITTLLSFGLMGLSSNFAVSSFGMTISVGILASWLLAPAIAGRKHFRKVIQCPAS
ncbi:MMPL family transporter [Paraferrimonas sedimenticola]|nr:MMPL family transporter [Paraferrimonas sedimenticola]